jgi:hypothetical protein
MSTNKFDNPADKQLLREVMIMLESYDKKDPYIENVAKRIIWKVEEYRGKL